MGTNATLEDIRKLAGYVEDGTSVVLKIFQDDATKMWHVHVERKSYYGLSMREALVNAYRDQFGKAPNF